MSRNPEDFAEGKTEGIPCSIFFTFIFTKHIFSAKFVAMELYLNTTHKDHLELALKDKGKIVARKIIKTNFNQSEKLWPNLDKLLKANKIKPAQLAKIVVASSGGSFTSLRIGIAAANALAFAWGIKVEDEQGKFKPSHGLQIVEPLYTKEPNIT